MSFICFQFDSYLSICWQLSINISKNALPTEAIDTLLGKIPTQKKKKWARIVVNLIQKEKKKKISAASSIRTCVGVSNMTWLKLIGRNSFEFFSYVSVFDNVDQSHLFTWSFRYYFTCSCIAALVRQFFFFVFFFLAIEAFSVQRCKWMTKNHGSSSSHSKYINIWFPFCGIFGWIRSLCTATL